MIAAWATRFGFDAGKLGFAARTGIAACVALLFAWLCGFEHPQWAAMTVWTASQPTRGQLFEKSFFRLAGTCSGTLAGVVLVMETADHPVLLIVGLAIWIALCTGIGNLQRGFVSYGTVLAGYTAAMVSLLDAGHPENALTFGADRLATVLTGVVIAMLAGWLLSPPANGVQLRDRVRGLLTGIVSTLANPGPGDTCRKLLSEMAAIEDSLDPHAAGSMRSRREARATRTLLLNALALILWRHAHPSTVLAGPVADALRRAADALKPGMQGAASAAFDDAAKLARERETDLADALVAFNDALDQWQAPLNRTAAGEAQALPVVLHRDWIGAREAMLRAGGAILLFGAIWVMTGWSMGAYMLVGLSVMVSLFSTFENPGAMLRFVLLGQILGALGALACRWLAWPLAATDLQLILLTMPFILIGSLLTGHRRTAATSFDYNMVLLLLLRPALPLGGSFIASVEGGLAVIAAPLVAMILYRFVYPATLRRRLETIVSMALHDLADIASDSNALHRRMIWRARLYHRTLRLVRLSERSGRASEEALDTSLALLDLGHAAMHCQELLLNDALSASDRRAVQGALARIRQIEARPERASSTLAHLSRRFSNEDAELLASASAGAMTLVAFMPCRSRTSRAAA